MKIYRYLYTDKGEIKIDEFDALVYTADAYFSVKVNWVQRKIPFEEIDKIKHNNYTMWSRSKNKKDLFKLHIIDKKYSLINKLKEQITLYEKEIEVLSSENSEI